MLYVIIHTRHNNENYLERFSEEQWNSLDEEIRNNPKKVLYVTDRIDDEKLKEFSEIIWVRIDAPHEQKAKVIIPFTPDNIPLMEENARQDILKKQKKWDTIGRIIAVKKLDDSEPDKANEDDVYAITVMSHNNKKYIERFSKIKWDYVPLTQKNDTTKYPYYSSNIKDKEFSGIEEIIWTRLYSSKLKLSAKVVIPFTPDNIPLMEKEAASEIQKRYEKWQKQIDDMERKKNEEYEKNHSLNLAHHEKIEKYFTEDMTDFDAIMQWKKLDFIMPAPYRILKIKKQLGKTWEQLIEICREMK